EILVRAEANDPDGRITEVKLLVYDVVYATVNDGPYEFMFRPTKSGIYKLTVVATDDVGFSTRVEKTVELVGPTDDFRLAMPSIVETNVSLRVSTLGATRQKGEPNHAGVTGGKSVWLAWTAPSGINSSGAV